jgi:hypothetical protein
MVLTTDASRPILDWFGFVIDFPMLTQSTQRTNSAWKFMLVRGCLLAAMMVYAELAMSSSTALDWTAPWIPSDHFGWFIFATVAAILSWADGWLLPWLRRRKPYPGDFARFLVRAGLFHGGGLWGVVLSMETRDARYAIVALVISSVMVLVLPRPRTASPISSPG